MDTVGANGLMPAHLACNSFESLPSDRPSLCRLVILVSSAITFHPGLRPALAPIRARASLLLRAGAPTSPSERHPSHGVVHHAVRGFLRHSTTLQAMVLPVPSADLFGPGRSIARRRCYGSASEPPPAGLLSHLAPFLYPQLRGGVVLRLQLGRPSSGGRGRATAEFHRDGPRFHRSRAIADQAVVVGLRDEAQEPSQLPLGGHGAVARSRARWREAGSRLHSEADPAVSASPEWPLGILRPR